MTKKYQCAGVGDWGWEMLLYTVNSERREEKLVIGQGKLERAFRMS